MNKILNILDLMKQLPQTKQGINVSGVLSTTSKWLQKKALKDREIWGIGEDQKDVWIIQNKKYDLKNFAGTHPGGEHWIRQTKGHDITQLFHTHHLKMDKPRMILNSYYLGECLKKNHRYTFQEKGLYQTVKRKLMQRYTSQQLQDTSITSKIANVYIIVWIILLLLSGYYSSYVCGVAAGLLIVPLTGIAHNFVHMKPSLYRFLYLLTSFTPSDWEVSHCISHHVHTNSMLDFEIRTLQPQVYYLRFFPKNKRFTKIILMVTFILITPLNMILKSFIVPLLTFTRLQPLYCLPLVQLYILYFLNSNLSTSLSLFITIHLTFGYAFYKTVLCQHRTQTLWMEGDAQIKDFGEHILATTTDVQPHRTGYLSFLFHSGFNIHNSHHFFPTIDNAHLPKVKQILDFVAKDFLLKQNSISMKECQQSSERNLLTRKVI